MSSGSGQPSSFLQKYWKHGVFIAGIGLLAVLVANSDSADPGVADDHADDHAQEQCPGHWHATVQAYVGTQRVEMAPTSANNVDAPGFHMHGDDAIFHAHPPTPSCIPLKNALRSVGVQVQQGSMTIEDLANADRSATTGTHDDGEGLSVAMYHQPFGGEWQPASWNLLDEQIGNGDKLLIVYSDQDPETIAQQQAAVPDLPPQYQPHG